MSIPTEPARVMKERAGSVLAKKTILKSDHFPGCHNKLLLPHIEGAPNYRKANSLPVHGVAIPTIDGIHNVLKHIGAQNKDNPTRVMWINLREEPVVYINSRPFVLRELDKPFTNVECRGISRVRVEQMEDRLKDDILVEASKNHNKILVTDELPDGQMVDQWEPVLHDSVKTPLEVYKELAHQYLVDYERVPVTDEKSPKEQDFDTLVGKICQADAKTDILFNCQMGRGRTTTGMVIATLIHINRVGASGIPRTYSMGRVSDRSSSIAYDVSNSGESIRRGEYGVIRSLIRVLEGGVDGKKQVDEVIDKCASMQNLREAIGCYRSSILCQSDEMKREALLSFFVEYLERYYFLICFAVYLRTEREALQPMSRDQCSFAKWMSARPELYSIPRRLLRRNPMGALSVIKNEISQVAAKRTGEVLGSLTILKSDHFPGYYLHPCSTQGVEGAPNFRKIPGFPIYGVANPTVDGIKSVIERIGSSRGGRPVLWHNMREEPVIYINGKPFVLREEGRPYNNMLEYSGIDCERIEGMEARLKEDILREAELYNGAIMVIHETDDRQISECWEAVNLEGVKTPLEVFRFFEAEGFPIKYARVPITDGKAPKSSVFDKIAMNIASASKDAAFVFSCQMGIGRTTMGTVTACLVKLRIDYGRPIKMPVDDAAHKEWGLCGEDCRRDCVPAATVAEEGHEFGINDILLLWKMSTLFDNGVQSREALDSIIDRCSTLQNLRLAVLQYRHLFNKQDVEPRERTVALKRGAEYLERYFHLIAFAAYLGSEAFDGFVEPKASRVTFKCWLKQRPEFQAMKQAIRLRPGRFFSVPVLRAPQESQDADAVMEAIVKARNGPVLGKGYILKMYFFPGQKTSSRIEINGAPNVYKVNGYPVYSMSTPTIAGAKEILTYLGAKSSEGSPTYKVVVTDLREETVVYINDIPFVLRELNKPVDTFKHIGITGPVVENMEARLKEDILSEIRQSSGRILLHREEHVPSTEQTTVVGYWEDISAADVKTPSEVYAALQNEGYDIAYKRIPMSREREPVASDVDSIQYCKDDSAGSYIFVSHTGYGGVAFALSIISIRLDAEPSFESPVLPCEICLSDDEERRLGEFREILSLTRVLVHGRESKACVDEIIDRCDGAGHARRHILYYRTDVENLSHATADTEQRAHVVDMGNKALRRYFLLIAFRSYLFKTSATEMSFAAWMNSRPELRHLCNNLRIDRKKGR